MCGIRLPLESAKLSEHDPVTTFAEEASKLAVPSRAGVLIEMPRAESRPTEMSQSENFSPPAADMVPEVPLDEYVKSFRYVPPADPEQITMRGKAGLLSPPTPVATDASATIHAETGTAVDTDSISPKEDVRERLGLEDSPAKDERRDCPRFLDFRDPALPLEKPEAPQSTTPPSFLELRDKPPVAAQLAGETEASKPSRGSWQTAAPPVFEARGVLEYAALVVLGLSLGGYALHEHRVTQSLAAQNEQEIASLSATRSQIDSLTAAVNALAARPELPPAPAPDTTIIYRTFAPRHGTEDPGLRNLQSQLDAQGKTIEDTRSDLAITQSDLTSTRTELTGSSARTHEELVFLQKKGERNYYEFDIYKSKQFQKEGPLGIRLKKANTNHQYADLELLIEDRDLSQKHVNLYQPVMFYTPDSPQPVELVINSISKDRIHGYVSKPKYRQSELALMGNANTQASRGAIQTSTSADAQSPPMQKLPTPK